MDIQNQSTAANPLDTAPSNKYKELLKNRKFQLAAGVLVLILLVIIIIPFLAPFQPEKNVEQIEEGTPVGEVRQIYPTTAPYKSVNQPLVTLTQQQAIAEQKKVDAAFGSKERSIKGQYPWIYNL